MDTGQVPCLSLAELLNTSPTGMSPRSHRICLYHHCSGNRARDLPCLASGQPHLGTFRGSWWPISKAALAAPRWALCAQNGLWLLLLGHEPHLVPLGWPHKQIPVEDTEHTDSSHPEKVLPSACCY